MACYVLCYYVPMIDEAVRYRVIRAIVGVSKAEMAKRLGVVVDTLSAWESGRRSPQAKPRRAIAEICQQHNISIRPDGYPVIG